MLFKLHGITTLWLLRVLCVFIFFCKNISKVPYFSPPQIFIFLTEPRQSGCHIWFSPKFNIAPKKKKKIHSTVFKASHKMSWFSFLIKLMLCWTFNMLGRRQRHKKQHSHTASVRSVFPLWCHKWRNASEKSRTEFADSWEARYCKGNFAEPQEMSRLAFTAPAIAENSESMNHNFLPSCGEMKKNRNEQPLCYMFELHSGPSCTGGC